MIESLLLPGIEMEAMPLQVRLGKAGKTII
jgi:hypothetical protein